LVKVLEGIVELAFGEICIAYIVQTQRFGIGVPQLSLNPQRFFEKLECVIVLPPTRIERAPVEQYRASASLVAHLTIKPRGLLVMIQCLRRLTKLVLRLSYFVQRLSDSALLSKFSAYRQSLLVLIEGLLVVLQSSVGGAHGVQNSSLGFIVTELDGVV